MEKGPRDEIVVLVCGCKVGRAGGGPWFFDYMCEEHVKQVYEEERYWECSTCGREFDVEGNGRVHISVFKHGVLYRRTRTNYSFEKATELTRALNEMMKKGLKQLKVTKK